MVRILIILLFFWLGHEKGSTDFTLEKSDCLIGKNCFRVSILPSDATAGVCRACPFLEEVLQGIVFTEFLLI